ncbi:MAG TPA: EamA family transporter [Flexistipes sinusarabici]|uniref:EamA family transporter n=1 Tax=Flexistipes sinusarabici TaxID=2352 RepID=A0A3D5QB92_FLESI|nr:EamA family transporter [Flexistipes sinusarabici]
MTGLLLIVFSAFMHSLWNILLKKSYNKYLFNYQMHFLNFCLMTIIYITFFSDKLYFDLNAVVFAFLSALFFTGYHLFLSTSYRYSDASLVYPITTSSPIWVTLWAVLFLNEKVTFFGLSGILITILGVLVMHSSRNSVGKLDAGVMYALISAFFYSIGAVIDKVGVETENFILYVYLLTMFMTFFMYLYSAKKFTNHFSHFKSNFLLLLSGSLVLCMSFFIYRVGLLLVQVSYATAIRQVNVLFGVLLGVIFLKEKFSVKRLVGSIIIFMGILIIRENL